MSIFNKTEFLERILVLDNGTPLCVGQFINIDGSGYKVTHIDTSNYTNTDWNGITEVLILIEFMSQFDKSSYSKKYMSITSSNYFIGRYKYDLRDKKELGNLKFINIPNMTDEIFFNAPSFDFSRLEERN